MPDTSTRNSLNLPLSTDGGQTSYTSWHTNFEIIDAAIAKCNWDSATDPGTGDDSADGYVAGSFWLNTTAHYLWICEDNTAGNAIWRQLYPSAAITTKVCGAKVTATGTSITVPNTPVANTYKLFKNGLRLLEGSGEGFTRDGTAVTLTTSAEEDDVFWHDYEY